ncbi:hypothetical protein NBRC10513_007652 [Rhodotorula toruloides]
MPAHQPSSSRHRRRARQLSTDPASLRPFFASTPVVSETPPALATGAATDITRGSSFRSSSTLSTRLAISRRPPSSSTISLGSSLSRTSTVSSSSTSASVSPPSTLRSSSSSLSTATTPPTVSTLSTLAFPPSVATTSTSTAPLPSTSSPSSSSTHTSSHSPTPSPPTPTTSSQAVAATAADAAALPGRSLAVLPIGLSILGSLLFVALLVVAYMLYERRRYRAQYAARQQRQAELAAAVERAYGSSRFTLETVEGAGQGGGPGREMGMVEGYQERLSGSGGGSGLRREYRV